MNKRYVYCIHCDWSVSYFKNNEDTKTEAYNLMKNHEFLCTSSPLFKVRTELVNICEYAYKQIQKMKDTEDFYWVNEFDYIERHAQDALETLKL